MMLRITAKILGIILTCLSMGDLFAQKIMLLAQDNQIFSVDLSTNNCSAERVIVGACSSGRTTSIALFRDTFYYTANGILYQTVAGPMSTHCKTLATGINPNSLTVDKDGMVYWIDKELLVKLNPNTLVQDVRGRVPFTASGDMIFYKDKLYLTATGGVVEVDIQDPSQSKMVIPAPGRDFSGFINIPVACSGNKVYGVESLGAFNNLVEFDLDQKTILGTYCTFSLNGLTLLDAASSNESGALPGITVENIHIKPNCWPAVNNSVASIIAYTPAGDTGLVYTLTNDRVTHGPISQQKGPFLLAGRLEPGKWKVNIKSSNGCSLDTTVTMPDEVRIVTKILIAPDTCNGGNGSGLVEVTGGSAPYTFALAGIGSQTSPVFRSLSSGLYKLAITDSYTCRAEFDFAVAVYTPPLPVTNVAIIPASGCGTSGGEIRLTYASSANVLGASLDGSSFQADNHFTGVSSGPHRLQLKTATCLYDTVINMPSAPGASPTISFKNKHPDCNHNNGSSTVNVSGAIAPVTVSFAGAGFGTVTQFNNLSAGIYQVIIKDGNGCEWKASDTILPYIPVRPSVVTSVNDSGCIGQGRVRLVISGADAPYRFQLSGQIYNSGQEATGIAAGTYSARILTSGGCPVDSFSITVNTGMNCDTLQVVYVPSAFTPNGDGKNDVLRPLKNAFGKVMYFVFRVYNRSGQVVFETRTPGKGWDGTFKGIQQPTATYVWVFQGTGSNGQHVTYKGTTLLLR